MKRLKFEPLKVNPEDVHKANMTGVWVTLALLLGLVGIVVAELNDDDDDDAMMITMDYVELEAVWTELCRMQNEGDYEKHERCE